MPTKAACKASPAARCDGLSAAAFAWLTAAAAAAGGRERERERMIA